MKMETEQIIQEPTGCRGSNLDRDLDLGSRDDNLANSDDNGRVVVLNDAVGVALKNFEADLIEIKGTY